MNAIILSAGRGSRLLPLTENLPKCLLPVEETTVLGYQLDTLAAAGIEHVTVVIGCLPGLVEQEVARRSGPMRVETLFNPFFQVADNLASCWMARERMEGDFLLINGDTLFEEALLRDVLAGPPDAIQVTIDKKPSYDSDDMKVTLDGTRLIAIGKTLPPERTHGESIGLLRFRGEGPAIFTRKLWEMMRTQDGVAAWYLKAIDAIAGAGGEVQTLSIEGRRWCELDTVDDYQAVERRFFGR